MVKNEIVYYEDEDSYTSSDDELHTNMSGGVRMTRYAQSGTNAFNTPYHFDETMEIASAGKLHIPKKMKGTVGKIAKGAAKEAYKTAKPIIVAEGKRQLQQGIKNMLSSEQEPSAAGAGKKPRGRPKKEMLKNVVDDAENLGWIIKKEEGGKRQLAKSLGAISREELLQEGFRKGVAYAKGGGGFDDGDEREIGGKFKMKKVGKVVRKIVRNPIVRGAASNAFGTAVGAYTENPIAGDVAASAMNGAMAAAGRKKGGGRGARGAIVSKIMKEKGLSLPLASKYVKDNNLY
jgi:hypothetical protein